MNKSEIHFQNDFSNFDFLKRELPKFFSRNDQVAVKLHMGEAGNKYFIKPTIVGQVVACMKEIGLKPFLFDSPVKYHGLRSTPENYLKTAKAHGFSENSIGCPVIVSDDFVEAETSHSNVQVCKPLAKADGMLVLSHVKGHACCGFGAAIKNLGMGAVTRKTKGDIHDGGSPVFKDDKDCVGCGKCAEYCPAGAISIKGKARFDYESCWGCNLCVMYCPQKVLRVKAATFDKLLAEGAAAVLSRTGKVYYMNVLRDIAQLCDCVGGGKNPIVAPDLGVLFGDDIVAIDKASMDLINEKMGHDLFLKINHKSPIEHIREAAALSMGMMEYEMRNT
jgi:uncharacterized Fe-S center protein